MKQKFRKFEKFFKIAEIREISDISLLFLCLNFLTPICLTLCGIDVCVYIVCNVICNFIYISQHVTCKKSALVQIAQDSAIWYFFAIVFGQPIFPLKIFENILWCLYTASSIHLFDRTVGYIFISAGLLVTSPLLVLDWMRWWQRWPIPSILGVSIGNILTIIFLKLRK